MDDPHREPDRHVVGQALEAAVAQVEVLAAQPLDAQVGVLHAQVARGLQRGVGGLVQGQGQQGGVDP